MIDLRSDTVTHPTPQMREAMARAEVGDDVYGEDPTVNRLEELAASKLGKEAAVFVASGTMGNLIALLTHCARGDEVIIGRQQHSFNSEAGGMAALGGITPYPLLNQPDGTLALDEIEHAIRHEDEHYPRTRLVVIENTHNYCGGQPLTVEYTRRVREIVSAHNLNLHIDGARIFNAAIALGVDVQDLVKDADSIQFCLSKGLSAPVGSLLVGSKDFIGRARRNRKMVGGGMRQAGIIAAAGIVALETMIDRLAEDHANAKYFAENLADLPVIGGKVDVAVTDGFVGNVMLKTAEAVGKLILDQVKLAIQNGGPLAMLGGLLVRPALRSIRKLLDPSEQGAAILLGVNGLVLIGHGRSDAAAIKSAIRLAKEAAEADVLGAIRNGIEESLKRQTASAGAAVAASENAA